MKDQVFSDGIGQVVIIGGTVRLDFVTYSAVEKDAKGQPAAVLSQRVVMSLEGFRQAAGKMQEATQALTHMAQRPEQPSPPAPEKPALATTVTPPKRPFP